MNSKSPAKSKTIIANAVAAVAAVATLAGVDVGLDDQAAQTELILGLTIAANFALRFATKTRLRLRAAPGAIKSGGRRAAGVGLVLVLAGCGATDALWRELAEAGNRYCLTRDPATIAARADYASLRLASNGATWRLDAEGMVDCGGAQMGSTDAAEHGAGGLDRAQSLAEARERLADG